MRTRLWFSAKAASSSAALTISCLSAAVITRTCTRSSCLKKSSKRHEHSTRGRGLRQSVRLALDAAALAVLEAVPLARDSGAGACGGGHATRARSTGHFPEGYRQQFRPGNGSQDARIQRVDGHHLAELAVLGGARVRFPRPVHPNSHHAARRPANHV